MGADGSRILDVVRFVDHNAAEISRRENLILEPSERLEGSDCDAAVAYPTSGCRLAARTVETVRLQRRLRSDFPDPVGYDGRWADHQGVMGSFGAQVREHRKRFDRLPEAHLVADDYFALDEGESRTEALVAAQRCREVLGVEFEPTDGLDDVVGKVTVGLLLVFGQEAELGRASRSSRLAAEGSRPTDRPGRGPRYRSNLAGASGDRLHCCAELA